MKNLIILAALVCSQIFFSQVIIGDNAGTATNKTSVLLEFANTGNKGIILPYVRTIPATPSEGTIILDATDATKAKVKYYNGVVGTNSPDGWQDLSGTTADVTTEITKQPTETQVTEGDAKAIIGATSSTADGVLVLESNTKAMVLPMVANTNDVPNPSPGMMVFVNKSGFKRLAVYNGNTWAYWKP
ncbi:MAG TPA: hypothetical protein DCQ50_09690 [Chryseobacterium sp.]|nr:hypothetical protein [Chryseobacterium sp.]